MRTPARFHLQEVSPVGLFLIVVRESFVARNEKKVPVSVKAVKVFKMSSTRRLNFRSFLTERFTTLAVEIFGEVERIIEDCYEENKHLRNILHMVVNPEIKLSRIGLFFLISDILLTIGNLLILNGCIEVDKLTC